MTESQLQFLVLEMRLMSMANSLRSSAPFPYPRFDSWGKLGSFSFTFPLDSDEGDVHADQCDCQPLPGHSGLHFPELLAGAEACFWIVCFPLWLTWSFSQLDVCNPAFIGLTVGSLELTPLLFKPIYLASEWRPEILLFLPVSQH